MTQPHVSVFIKTDSHYRVNREKVRTAIFDILIQKRVKGKVDMSIAIVGNRQMKKLNEQYRNVSTTTDVLSFSLSEQKDGKAFVAPPDDTLHLGDIVVCYPVAVEEASEQNKMVDDKINELIEHGLLHLLGFHHD